MMVSLAHSLNTPPRNLDRTLEGDSSLRIRTPTRSISDQHSPSCFVTPKRSLPQKVNSPFRTPGTAAFIRLKNEYENIQSTHDYGECRVVLRKDLFEERKKIGVHEIEKTTLYRLLFEQGRPWCIVCKYSPSKATEEDTYNNIVAIAPMSDLDYDALNVIRDEYVASISAGSEVFLERQYGTRDQFMEKLDFLNRAWENAGNVNRPILYTQPKDMFTDVWEESDPHFGSSVPFTIFYASQKSDVIRTQIVGDVWFSHFDNSDLLCLYGTTERSTMIALKHQGKNIGPTAVKGIYSQLVHPWTNQNVQLIDFDAKTLREDSREIFDGVISYVDPRNFLSIGQNIRSGNIIFGINDEGMLMFRAVNPLSCTMLNILGSLRKNGRIVEYEKIKILLNKLYPSKEVIKDQSPLLKDFRAQQEAYVNSPDYNIALQEFRDKFSDLFLIEAESPLKKKTMGLNGAFLQFPDF